MWVGKVRLDELEQRDRWKVEFFCGAGKELPTAGYPLTALRDLVDERRETIDPQAHSSRPFNYLGLENVGSKTGDLVAFAPKLGVEIRSRSKVFHTGDVMYGRLRPYLNKVYVAAEPVASGICSGEFYVFAPRGDRVLPNFLRALLASAWVQRYVAEWQTGSALPRLALVDLLQLRLPIPPLEQQRIFEAYILEQTRLRRELSAKLKEMPDRMLQQVEAALQSGETPIDTKRRR